MSDHWEVYSTQINDQPAYILYDHGLSETINDLALPHCLHVLLEFKQPNAEGLPVREEFDQLVELEDEIEKALNEHGGVYAGRISSAGERRLLFYVSETEDSCQERVFAIGQRHGYTLQYAYLHEPEKQGYWEFLFPNADEYRCMMNLKVLHSLGEHGDQAELARDIDHYATFTSETSAHRYAHAAQDDGFALGNINPPDDERPNWQVHLQINSPAIEDAIHPQTLRLTQLATECEGEYDGWGCPIAKDEASADSPFNPLA